MNKYAYLVTGGQHIAGMEGEYLFPYIPHSQPIQYFTHGVDSLSGQSVFFYLKNPLVEATAAIDTYQNRKGNHDIILRQLVIDKHYGLRDLIYQNIAKRLGYFRHYFHVNESVIERVLNIVKSAAVKTNIDMITKVQGGTSTVGCLSDFQEDFYKLNGVLGLKDDWWYVFQQYGKWFRSKEMQQHDFIFPSAKPMFIGLLMLTDGLLTPHFPWYYEDDFIPELIDLDLLQKRYVVQFTRDIEKIDVVLRDDSFLPDWVPRPVRLGQLLWLSTQLDQQLYGLRELFAFGQGKILTKSTFVKHFFSNITNEKEAREYMKSAGGWMAFITQQIQRNALFSNLDIADRLQKIAIAKSALATCNSRQDIFPIIGLVEKDIINRLGILINEIELVAQVSRTIKNCWSFPEWELLDIDPYHIASCMEVVPVTDYYY